MSLIRVSRIADIYIYYKKEYPRPIFRPPARPHAPPCRRARTSAARHVVVARCARPRPAMLRGLRCCMDLSGPRNCGGCTATSEALPPAEIVRIRRRATAQFGRPSIPKELEDTVRSLGRRIHRREVRCGLMRRKQGFCGVHLWPACMALGSDGRRLILPNGALPTERAGGN